MECRYGIRTTDRLFGVRQTGHVSDAYVAGVIARLPAGTTEIYFHPAEDLGAAPLPPAARLETQILKSPRVRKALIDAGAQLTSFAEIARARR
jgi:hypothetical protein